MRSSFHQANFLSNICCWLGVTHNATQSWSGNVIYIFLFLFTLTQLPNWPKNTLDQIRTLKTQLLFRYPNGLYSTAAHYTQVYHIKCNLYKSVKIVCSLSAGGKVSGSCWKYISFFPARTNLCQSTCLRLSLFWGGTNFSVSSKVWCWWETVFHFWERSPQFPYWRKHIIENSTNCYFKSKYYINALKIYLFSVSKY